MLGWCTCRCCTGSERGGSMSSGMRAAGRRGRCVPRFQAARWLAAPTHLGEALDLWRVVGVAAGHCEREEEGAAPAWQVEGEQRGST